MKTNPNDPAFARPCGQNEEKFNHGTPGLTKLEWLAGLALQGIKSKPFLLISAGNESAEHIRKQQAIDAVLSAKALIDELNKEEENK